jgi:hypothetical protein
VPIYGPVVLESRFQAAPYGSKRKPFHLLLPRRQKFAMPRPLAFDSRARGTASQAVQRNAGSMHWMCRMAEARLSTIHRPTPRDERKGRRCISFFSFKGS